MNAHCTLTSVWDGGIAVTTPATIDLDTGLLMEIETPADVIGLCTLEDEYITMDDGKEYKICTHCHESVMGFLGRWDDGKGNYIPKHGCPVCNNYHLVGGIQRWMPRHCKQS